MTWLKDCHDFLVEFTCPKKTTILACDKKDLSEKMEKLSIQILCFIFLIAKVCIILRKFYTSYIVLSRIIVSFEHLNI